MIDSWSPSISRFHATTLIKSYTPQNRRGMSPLYCVRQENGQSELNTMQKNGIKRISTSQNNLIKKDPTDNRTHPLSSD